MTPEQQRTLGHIRDYVAMNGLVPTVRELMAIEGLRSTSSLWNRLQALIAMGHLIVDKRGGRYRSYRVAGDIDLTCVPTNRLRDEIERREASHG